MKVRRAEDLIQLTVISQAHLPASHKLPKMKMMFVLLLVVFRPSHR